MGIRGLMESGGGEGEALQVQRVPVLYTLRSLPDSPSIPQSLSMTLIFSANPWPMVFWGQTRVGRAEPKPLKNPLNPPTHEKTFFFVWPLFIVELKTMSKSARTKREKVLISVKFRFSLLNRNF